MTWHPAPTEKDGFMNLSELFLGEYAALLVHIRVSCSIDSAFRKNMTHVFCPCYPLPSIIMYIYGLRYYGTIYDLKYYNLRFQISQILGKVARMAGLKFFNTWQFIFTSCR